MAKQRASEMASVKLISENEVTGEIKAIGPEIKSTLGADFVPNVDSHSRSPGAQRRVTSKEER
jgi:hypothetical protein